MDANINNIIDSIRYELEKILAAYFHKKLVIKTAQINYTQFASAFSGDEASVYAVFRIAPSNGDNAFIFHLSFLNQAMNLLFGGQVSASESYDKAGRLGVIVAQGLGKVCLEALTLGCKEYGTLTCDILKTTDLPTLIPNLNSDANVYQISFQILFDEVDTSLDLLLSAQGLASLLPENMTKSTQQNQAVWKNIIKNQVIDSHVAMSAQLAEMSMNIQEFMSLKNGDVIPVGDPTQIFLCLNNMKLFKGIAGQVNGKRVAKITSKM